MTPQDRVIAAAREQLDVLVGYRCLLREKKATSVEVDSLVLRIEAVFRSIIDALDREQQPADVCECGHPLGNHGFHKDCFCNGAPGCKCRCYIQKARKK